MNIFINNIKRYNKLEEYKPNLSKKYYPQNINLIIKLFIIKNYL